MRILIVSIFILISGKILSQDTLLLRGAYPMVVKVIELDEDKDYVIYQKLKSTTPLLEKVRFTDIRCIKFKGGFVQSFKPHPTNTYLDKIQLIDARVKNCLVVELSEDSVILDIENSDKFITIAIDSIASIAYKSGLETQYNELRIGVNSQVSDLEDIKRESIGEKNKFFIDSVIALQKFYKFILSSNIDEQIFNAKGNYENIKELFETIKSSNKLKDSQYNKVFQEVILEYCRLFEENYFSGRMKEGIPEGIGDFYKPNGEIQSGNFINGKLEGYGKITRITESQKREGNFKEGELNGDGIIIDEKGKVIKGTFVENLLSGPGIVSFKSGAFAKGNFYKGLLNGEGERHFENGNFYKGFFKSGKYDGYGEYNWKDEAISYVGNFINGKRSGIGEMKLADSTSINGEWKNDCPEGELKTQKEKPTNGKYYTLDFFIKDCKIEKRKGNTNKVNFDESLLFIKMSGY